MKRFFGLMVSVVLIAIVLIGCPQSGNSTSTITNGTGDISGDTHNGSGSSGGNGTGNTSGESGSSTPTIKPFVVNIETPPSEKRNTDLTLSIMLENDYEITKVIFKEGNHSESIIYYSGTVAIQNATPSADNKVWTITVSKNATYTVVAQDTLNRNARQTVDVGCFDYGPSSLSAGTDGSAGTDWTYVTFGNWSRTIKADYVLVDDTCESKEVGMFTYYKGTDGEWYCKVLENAYSSQYKYSNGEQVAQKSAKSYKYFKVEPIKWRVLTNDYNGKKLLLAEEGLTSGIAYGTNSITRSIHTGKTQNGLPYPDNVYPNNYRHSYTRSFLLGMKYDRGIEAIGELYDNTYEGKGFLQTAFISHEQDVIASVEIDNSPSSANPANDPIAFYKGENLCACNNTNDKIFLLSEKEITTSDYGFTEYNIYGEGNSRIRKPTDFALANGAYCGVSESKSGYWFLRSPENRREYSTNEFIFAYGVGDTGQGNRTWNVSTKYMVVVPALCVEP